MAISQLLDPDSIASLKQKLKGDFKRLDEMYLGDPALRDAEVFFFVERLLEIRDQIFSEEILPALHTSQGAMRSMQEFFGRRDDASLRNKLRSHVLLKAAVVQWGIPEAALANASDFKLKEDMKSMLREANEIVVTRQCDVSAKTLKDAYDAYVTSLTPVADPENQRARIAAANKIKRNYKKYKLRRKLNILIPHVETYYANYNQVGTKVLEAKADKAISNVQTAVLARTNHKFIQFQKKWNGQADQLHVLGRLIDEVNSNFMTAVKADDAAFAAARNFKKDCVKNLFSAVTSYAPPPFNLIGTVGTIACKGVGLAYQGGAAAAQIIKQRTNANSSLRKAVVSAEERVKSLENTLFADHGVETNLEASSVSSVETIMVAQREAAQQFYDALERVNAPENSVPLTASYLGDREARRIKSRTRMQLLFNDNWNTIARGGNIRDLKDKVKDQMGDVYSDRVHSETKRAEALLKNIQVPDLGVNFLGNNQLLKRYLYLYLAGLYLDEKLENNKQKFFKFQMNIRDLLEREDVAFLHRAAVSKDRVDNRLGGMSLPYVFGTTVYTHDGRLVRVNTLLRLYTDSFEYNPFSIMLNPKVTKQKVVEYFDGLDARVFADITTAREMAKKKARKVRYHDIEQRVHHSGPLRNDGSFFSHD